MGVEYRHFLVVADEDWHAQSDTALRVDAVLRSYALVAAKPEVYDLTGGRKASLPEIPWALPGPGIAICYPMVQNPIITSLVGQSFYKEMREGDRYIQKITLVVGMDFRVHWSSEGLGFSVSKPANESGREVAAYSFDPGLNVYSESYPATPSTKPPEVEVTIERWAQKNVAWQGYTGAWRAGLVLDCGKDLPDWLASAHSLRSQEFVNAVASAFRARLHEVGEVY